MKNSKPKISPAEEDFELGSEADERSYCESIEFYTSLPDTEQLSLIYNEF